MPTPVRQDRPFEQDGLLEPILSIQTVPTFDAFPEIGKKRRMLGRFRCPQGSEDKPTPLEATIPVSNHEFPQVILPFLKRLASVALEAHSECDGVHRPVQLQLMGKLSPSEDDHPKA